MLSTQNRSPNGREAIESLEAQIYNLQLEVARLQELVYKDALTGVANRRMFDERLSEEWNRGDRTVSPIALLLIDIDHFKTYNDTHGHQGGDELLQDLGRLWSDVKLRSYDLLARFGGEEFAVILPDTSIAGAARIAERFQAAAHVKGVTVSIGAASVIPDRYPPSGLIEAADQALYRAKADGRDRVVLA